VDFLVDIAVRIPADLEAGRREELIAAERVRGRELVDGGVIRHIWRIPGALRNVSVWRAADATQLHALLTSLPSYPYATITVTPLAEHPLMGGPERG
jgi:muconolactone D-isomerase